jgi:hypothetical protein
MGTTSRARSIWSIPVLLDRREALLERRLGVDPVQVVERDAVRPQAAKALLDLGVEHLRPPFARPEAAFRCDDAILRDRRQRSTDRLLALAPGVEVGGVDVPEPGGERTLDERDVLGCVREAIRPEPDARDLDAGQTDRLRRGQLLSRAPLRAAADAWRGAAR